MIGWELAGGMRGAASLVVSSPPISKDGNVISGYLDCCREPGTPGKGERYNLSSERGGGSRMRGAPQQAKG